MSSSARAPESPDRTDGWVSALRARAGFREDAIQPEVLLRTVAAHTRRSAETLTAGFVQEAVRGDAELARKLFDTMLVAETYFFRHPEHFVFLVSWAQARVAEGQRQFRAWSAGCASGEEAYSLAACLRSLGPSVAIEVLGTDLSERSLERARAGHYGSWSRRSRDPLPYPVAAHERDTPSTTLSVDPAVAKATRFRHHNLLDPLTSSEGLFDVIFCRNVLVYLEEEAVHRVCANLADRLAPGGVLILGNVDSRLPPSGLQRTGPATISAFGHPSPPPDPAPAPARALVQEARPAVKTRVRIRSARQRADAPDADAVGLHTRALLLIERGRHEEAQTALSELARLAPTYLPGMLERALLFGRSGLRERGEALMHELLRRLEGRAADDLLAGPESLPVSFYRASAQAYLGSRSARREG